VIALVTGVAGFIGSNLAARLVADGWDVRGVDRFTAYYEETAKRGNLTPLLGQGRFELIEADLLTTELNPLLDGVNVVFHQAGQPGVRMSWADGFRLYNEINVDVTQRLLEATRRANVDRFVYASSSSVYGNATNYPTLETDITAPFSPYGVTKLAAELLCNAYANNFGVPVTSLRYFTVYGPAQRPDMAIHRMIEATLNGGTFPVFGDGSQVRDFTFVGDVVEANLRAATTALAPGAVVNIAGGSSTTLAELIDVVGSAIGESVPVERHPAQPGDVTRTGGSIDRARELLGWAPTTGIVDGVAEQVRWHRARTRPPA
jgi:nucleoside-diphosphate-sugar epimerase